MSETDDDRTGHEAGDRESDGGSILDGGIDTDARAGRSQGIDPTTEPDEETQREIEQEREERLAPENRPDGAEVDNTQRTFDTDRGMFTDNDDYTEEAPAPFAESEESS